MEIETPPPKKRRRRWNWLLGLVILLSIAGAACWQMMIAMPGESYTGELAELAGPQRSLRDELRRDVEKLADEIGERNIDRYPSLVRAAGYVESEFAAAGYEVERQTYEVRDRDCWNLVVELPGTKTPQEIVVVGAHYDSYLRTPGANDNGSGTAALLALARRFAGSKPERTLRFVAFTNEEPPYFQRPTMGSWVYAQGCRQRREDLVCVLSLETIGYYTNEPGSQEYPQPLGVFYPSEGNFIGVIGNVGSRELVRAVIDSFRRHGHFPSQGGAVPSVFPGVGWSDHWSFWQEGYPAAMITDTAPFRYPYYHTSEDTPDKLNFDHMARVVSGIAGVIEDYARIK